MIDDQIEKEDVHQFSEIASANVTQDRNVASVRAIWSKCHDRVT